ncbi:type I-E CRISPR-associated protein Cas6/Cse3/CasE [Solihabitans fulvus]|uniref:Type I-E CRISPR-associated protein Cas6/Cse3/CasE n=1 Tax=Solihabitans fulvus TaxID=1892852 RepID=A0A5B2W6R7_9PSEU|nr:type I-E CRISPR-associated protein Cas6/Cse3/CasE [Solihabitans fulvus]KAA2246400.1 type I-E CRISPR-associated protein Cas6/Cse3/CasE [Solihabitans fulvus]
MFLTKLNVNVRSREFRRDFANIHDMHRTVMSAYPAVDAGIPARQAHGVLWRLDPTHSGYIQYTQSHTIPDWTRLPPGYLATPAEVRPLQPVLDAIAPGRKLLFRILANATQDIRPPELRGASRRVAHRSAESQINWLIGKGERHGFVIPTGRDGKPDVAPSPVPNMTGDKGGTKPITIGAVRFDGHLIITDAQAFTDAVVTGIGRARAYGCGLLTVAPPHNS